VSVEDERASSKQLSTSLDVPRSFVSEAYDQLRLAAPVCLGLLCNRFVGTCSVVLVGRQGAAELAAVGLAVSIANVSGYSLLVGVSTTLQTTAGQAFGARNFTEVSQSVQRCSLLCTFMLCIIAVMWLNAKTLLRLAGQEPNISALAARYLAFLLPGVCCYMVTQVLQNWLAAQRCTGPSGTGGIINTIVYLPLCWFLVHPAHLGFIGAAVATSASNFFLMLWMVLRTRHFLRTELRMSWQGFSTGALTQWCPFLRLALPNLLMISEWWASEITVLMAGVLPDPHLSLGSLAAMANTNAICFMAPVSMGTTANTRVSNELGAGHPSRARHASFTSCALGLVIASVTSLAVFTCRRQWAWLFTSDTRVLDHIVSVMAVCSAYVLADGMAVVISGSLKGCGRHALLAPVIIAVYYFVGLPCSWALAWPLHLRTIGLALGSTVGTYMHAASFLILLLTTRWAAMAERARDRQTHNTLLQGVLRGNTTDDDRRVGG